MRDTILSRMNVPRSTDVRSGSRNYLNGGTNRGQADGFDLEGLSALSAVKAADGKSDLRHFCMERFLALENGAHARAALQELEPLFLSRRDLSGTPFHRVEPLK